VLRSGPVSPQQPPSFNGSVANLYEEVGDGPTEVSKAGFSTEGGKSQRAWPMTPASAADLVSVFPAILGTVQYNATGTGKLARTLPVADPLYPWMYASSIPTVEGYGTTTPIAADPQLEASAFRMVASGVSQPNQPAWLSAPLETLWTDCGSKQGVS